ncbi:MAG: 4-hydroxyphenylpyruvate dioxygenase [Saprospiraceae bacterium]
MNDVLSLSGIDFVELYVVNAKQAAYYYMAAFGFQPLAFAGLETGQKDRESYVLQQGNIQLVLTSPLLSGTEIGQHIDKHGDGISRIALTTQDATLAHEETLRRGANSFLSPMILKDDFGNVTLSGIDALGDVKHLFVERKDYRGVFLPGYEKWKPQFQVKPAGLKDIDHMALAVELGTLEKWTNYYDNILGFNQIFSMDDTEASTEYTALMNKILGNGNGRIKFSICEPARGKRKSQIDEYLGYYGSAGVQHLAFATDEILETVASLKSRGVEFLHVPDDYYDGIGDRIGEIKEEMAMLQDLRILADRDEEGYLMQIFTKPVQPRPTLFLEVIQRNGCKSFGKGNFKALFEAVEREQMRRGNLV